MSAATVKRALRQRPGIEHDSTCRQIRWVHQMPWKPGAPVMAVCLGCTAVKRIDGFRIRMVNGGPAVAGRR